MVQFSHPYTTTGKTIGLIRQTFVGKVMSLLFNMLSRLVIAFLQRSKRVLILRLQSPSAVILETKKIMSVTVSIVSPYICHEVFPLFPHLLTHSWHYINSYYTWCINTSMWFFFKSISIICNCWILTLCQAGHCCEPRGEEILMFLLTHIVKFSPQRLTFNRIYSEKTIAKKNNLSYEIIQHF